ncbi:MAG: hypothetical protein DBX47_03080 [Clostridiales bacterium]|nr:MAG: hypothetical protein DBX47_03080 [Clostridiales bacterium]
MKKRVVLSILLAVSLFITLTFSSCSVIRGEKYDGPFSDVNGTYAAVDDLGRELVMNVAKPQQEKAVGIFYFLWQGEHDTFGPYDNEKIVAQNPDAVLSEENWLNYGGGGLNAHHFWGEPLFGYYTSKDKWVMRKHAQMLTDAGVDFIVIDTTNTEAYTDRAKDLISVWYELYDNGYDVPKIAFYTNTDAATRMGTLYTNIYKSTLLNRKYPKLSELWYNWNGKPMIVGTSTGVSAEIKEYFTIKDSQWPNDKVKKPNGFPWMEFDRSLTKDAVYGVNGRKEVINVSIAQHNETQRFSNAAWYGSNDRTRSWHDGSNDTSENALLYGYNFAEQWDFALQQDTEMIFITGWNEWVAQRQPSTTSGSKGPIVFVDCADPNTSRDAEPTAGAMGDNYYLQMADYIRKYKGTESRVYVGDSVTIDVNGSFDQWNSEKITAKYVDYKGDTVNRYGMAFGGTPYTDYTGRNDFYNMKTARDDSNLYFYADTVNDITIDSSSPMFLYINSGIKGNTSWYGYDYRISVELNAATLQKYDGSAWQTVEGVDYKIEGNKLMISVPRASIGVEKAVNNNILNIQFKWTDNCKDNDIWSFYQNGDAAPLGRMNYVYSEAK